MKILGLSYGFHDSSAALVLDGKIHSAFSEERFTRQKHDRFFPQFSVEACLQAAGLKMQDVDQVVFYENTPQKFGRILKSILTNWPHGLREFNEAIKSWLGQKLWTTNQIISRLGISPEKVTSMSHHEAHAYQAFVGSGFADAAILTVDAVGEWPTTGLWEASWNQGRPQFRLIQETVYPHSLGLFYSAMTAFLGFKPMNDECTTMALAAFGRPTYLDFFRSIVKVVDGKVWLDPDYFQFDLFYQSAFTEILLARLGNPGTNLKYSFSSYEQKSVSSQEQHMADIAASVQAVFEESVLTLASYLQGHCQSKNLCFAGGAALNCVGNTKLFESSGFENIFIPVDPGDGGAAMGAAYFGYFQKRAADPSESVYTPDLGRVLKKGDSFTDVVKQIDIKKLKKFSKYSQREVLSWEVEEIQDPAVMAKVVSEEIHHSQIIGWFQGHAEYGPRALGHRSILIRPDNPSLALRLSQSVKERALFRPYALSMTESAVQQILEISSPRLLQQRSLEWMQFAVPIRSEMRKKVFAAMHIDGTTRPQVVKKQSSPLFHLLIEKYGELSGLNCLVNTSFNESGYPIVSTPMEALLMFARTDMDVLVVNQTLIRKVRISHAH